MLKAIYVSVSILFRICFNPGRVVLNCSCTRNFKFSKNEAYAMVVAYLANRNVFPMTLFFNYS